MPESYADFFGGNGVSDFFTKHWGKMLVVVLLVAGVIALFVYFYTKEEDKPVINDNPGNKTEPTPFKKDEAYKSYPEEPYKNVLLWGTEVDHITRGMDDAIVPQECAYQCSINKHCNAFTLDSDTNTCMLKNLYTGVEGVLGLKGYEKVMQKGGNPHPNSYNYGIWYKKNELADDEKECASQCAAEPRCNSYTLRYNGRGQAVCRYFDLPTGNNFSSGFILKM